MGRKKKPDDKQEQEAPSKEGNAAVDSDSSDFEREPRNYDIDDEIQELAYAFGIDDKLTQQLNDVMIEEREKTWEADMTRLYEVLKEARSPAAMLALKVKDMKKGTFVGKAKCGPAVHEVARRHRLDANATTKLVEAMAMREGMGKDVEKDLQHLDEHMSASNAPSKLISMKLEALRKGFSVGHCIYSREPMAGGQGPGVDGVFDSKAKRALGYTDADLGRRFSEQQRERLSAATAGGLMDEATVRRMVAAERKQFESTFDGDEDGERKHKARRKKSASRSRRKKRRSRSRSRKGKNSQKRKSRSRSRKRSKSGKRSRGDKKGKR